MDRPKFLSINEENNTDDTLFEDIQINKFLSPSVLSVLKHICGRDEIKKRQNVFAAIRPEGFTLDEDGAMECELSNVEVMGRDVSVVSRHAASVNPIVRSIINADNKVDLTAQTVRYSLKPHKVFLFNAETEERIYF